MTVFDSKSSSQRLKPVLPDPRPAAPLTPVGPLTRIVQQGETPRAASPAQAGAAQATTGNAAAGRDWQAVAQKVAETYHQLQGRASKSDLLGALRGIPDAGAQERAVTLIGGPDAEGLRLALKDGGEGKAKTGQVIPLRRSSPGNEVKKEAAPSPSTPAQQAAQTAPTTAKPKLASLAAKNPDGQAAKPAREPLSAESGKRRALQLTPSSPTEKKLAEPPRVKAPAAQRGKGAKGGGLHVVKAAQLAELGLNPESTMQQGGKVALSDMQWQNVQEQARQALKARQPGAVTPAQAALPEPAKPQPDRKKPQDILPSAQISGAEIQAETKKNRDKNSQTLQASLARARKHRTALQGLLSKSTPPITQAQKAAEQQVQAALQSTLKKISSAAASARASVNSSAAKARSAVTSAHASTVAGIRADTVQKRAAVKQEMTRLGQTLNKGKTKLDADVRSEFSAAQQRMKSIGNEVSATARSNGNNKAAQYAAEALPEQNWMQKLANGSDYYEKKRQAKVDAAHKVGSDYADGMVKAGNDQAGKLGESLPQALASNAKLLQGYTDNLTKMQTSLDQALTTQQNQAIQAANTQKTALLQSIDQQKQGALQSIASTQNGLQSQTRTQASKHQQGIRQQGSAALQKVKSSVQGAQQGLDGQISKMQSGGQQQLDQDSAEFTKSMQGFEALLNKSAQAAQENTQKTATQSATALKSSAKPAVQALSGLASSAAQSLKQTASGAAQGMTAAGTRGAAQLKQVLAGHKRATQAVQKKASEQARQLSSGFTKDAGNILKNVKEELKKGDDPFRSALNNVLSQGSGETKAEIPAIEEAAQKAADAVKPRWKAVLNVIIDIVVVIAVIAVTAVLATVLGPVALIFAGMALGALSAVIGQGLHDLVNGEFSGWKAYGMAAVGGAIGGAFGGAGGALSGKLAGVVVKESLGKFAQIGARFALDTVVGTGFDLAGQVATGYTNQAIFNVPYDFKNTFTVQNVLSTAGMNAAGNALPLVPSAAKFVKGKLSNLDIPGKGLLGDFKNTLSVAGHGEPNTPHNTNIPEGGLEVGKTNPSKVNPDAPQIKTPKAPLDDPMPFTGDKANTQAKPGNEPRPTSEPNKYTRPEKPGTPQEANPAQKANTEAKNAPQAKPKDTATAPEMPPPTVKGSGEQPGAGQQPKASKARSQADSEAQGGALNKSVKNDKPDISKQFKTTETTDSNGVRRVSTEGELGVPGKVKEHRNPSEQRKLSKGTGDDAGHRIANIFGAAGDKLNLALQNWKMNRSGTWKQLENLWARALKRGGKVNAKVTDVFRPGENRPFYRKAEWEVKYPNGATEKVDNVLYGNFHTPESRKAQGIAETVSSPQENNVIQVDFSKKKVVNTEVDVNASAKNPEVPRPTTETTPVKPLPDTPKVGTETEFSTKGYQPKPGERTTTRQEWQAQDRLRRIEARRARVEQELNTKFESDLAKVPEGPRKERLKELLKQVDDMDFSTRPDQASVYSGAVGGTSNRDLALAHMKAGGDAIDGTPGGKALEKLKLYDEFADDPRLADLVWRKASMKYAKGAKGDLHLFVEGANPARVFGTVEKPLLQSNKDVERWMHHPNPGKTAPDLSTPKLSSPSELAAKTAELTGGLPERLQGKVPVEVDPNLRGNTVKVDYEFGPNGVQAIRVKAGPHATPKDIELHAQTITALQKYSGLQGRVRMLLDGMKRKLGFDQSPPPGSRAWEAQMELEKLDGIIRQRQGELAAASDPARQVALQDELASLEAQVRRHEYNLSDFTDGVGSVAMSSTKNGESTSGSTEPRSVKADSDLASELRAKTKPGTSTDTTSTSQARSKLTPDRTAEPAPKLSDLPDAYREAPTFETQRIDTWEELGTGGNKEVYGASEQVAVAVLKVGRKPEVLLEELEMLKTLQELGLPTIKAELALVDGYPALVMKRMAEGSKGTVRLKDGKVRIVADSPILNTKSIRDLQAIRQKMVEDKIKIDDLQFLIGEDGTVVIADPLAIHLETEPSKNNLRMIDLLIQQAQKNEASK